MGTTHWFFLCPTCEEFEMEFLVDDEHVMEGHIVLNSKNIYIVIPELEDYEHTVNKAKCKTCKNYIHEEIEEDIESIDIAH